MKKTMVILVTAVFVVFAQSDISAILDKYLNSLVEIDFEQRTYWHVRERETRVKGKIILGTNDKFNISVGKWNYVSNGTTFWEYNNRQKQVNVQKIMPELSRNIPTQLLKLLKDAKFVQNKATNSVIWQDNESLKNGYEKVEVFFTNSQITRIIINDTDKNITTYTFEKVTFLNEVSDDIFNFIIPQGAQIHEN